MASGASTTSKSAKVVPIKSAVDQKESERKWGVAVMKLGYCILPSILLQAQARLLITPQQMMVLLQLVEHWWKADNKVYPSKETLADRIGLSAKQVQRPIKALEEKKLVKRIPRTLKGRGKTSNEYDLSGLVKKLKEIEPDLTKARKLKSEAAKPGGLTAALKAL
jgi:predicted transcriptional regulator